jgi:glycosyltransferase involved in cell wall biosynthesis
MVSVIIPCYNATRFIAETLNCLRAQTFRDFEIILANDGCPDTENLEKALEPYRDEIVYLKSGKHASASGSRNNAINASRARYVALLDSDDFFEPDYLAANVEFLEANPQMDLVFSNAVFFGDTEWTGTFIDASVPASEITLREVATRERIVYVGVTAKREALVRAGLFDPEVLGGEDLDLWLRLLRIGGRTWYSGRCLCRYRIHGQQQSSRPLESLKRHLGVYRKHLDLPGLSEEERGWFEAGERKLQAEANLYLGKQALYRRQRDEAIDLLSRSNTVSRANRITIAILALRFAPRLLYLYVHRKYPTEKLYLS